MARTPLLNVGELITDPDFCQDFTVIRKAGSWNEGRFETTETTIDSYGIIDPQTTTEVQFNPDGALIHGIIKVYTHMPLYTTRKFTPIIGDTSTVQGYISDRINWSGHYYIVLEEDNYKDYGYRGYTCQLEEASGATS